MFGRVRGASLMRSRWAAIGAAMAVAVGGGGIGWIAHAAGDSAPSSFVSITPCRLFDTRPPTDNVGDRTTALGTGETFARQVWGTNGGCTIPSTATGIAYNLTVPDPTVSGFIKLFPGDAAAPNASAINPVAGGGNKANSGIVGLSATGGIKLFIQTGPINALLDITGYFVPTGQRGVSAWDTIPSGQTVTGSFGFTKDVPPGVNFYTVALPAKAPVALTDVNVNFKQSGALTFDNDASCTGTAGSPTAPAGKVCLYIDTAFASAGTVSSFQGIAAVLGNQSFGVFWIMPALVPPASSEAIELIVTWAYTAP